MVYAVKCNEFIKIGYTNNLKKRLSGMKVDNPYPLEVVKVLNGNKEIEQELHSKLTYLKHSQEWFKDTKELRKILDDYTPFTGKDLIEEKSYMTAKEIYLMLELEKLADERGKILIVASTRKQLAAKIETHPTNISKYLKGLVDLGMIEGKRGDYKLLRIMNK